VRRSAAESDIILERMMRLHPKTIDLTLERVHRLLARLGHPERDLPPVIHIAGTNGKGSTLAMIRAGLEAAGAQVHAYTSPHLVRFHERISLAGRPIDESRLAAILDECEKANGGEPITYFEITTCAAFLAFAREKADWLLLEVGLGGRLDATNVVEKPALVVLTPVSLDHQAFLGESVAEIAAEKAGILKPGVPAIVGPQEEAAREVIVAQAARLAAPLSLHGQDWTASEEHGRLVWQGPDRLWDLPLPALPGPHQIENAGTAVAALAALGFREEIAAAALANARWPARMERLGPGPLAALAPQAEIWLDGGHNAAAGAALAATLKRLPPRPTWLVAGMLGTKDADAFLAPLATLAEGLFAVPVPDQPAGLAPGRLAALAEVQGLAAEPVADVAAALARIHVRAPAARILICGSLYLAGSVLAQNRTSVSGTRLHR